MDIKDLPAIEIGEKHNVLLLGNGINRLFSGESCESLIKDEIGKSDVVYSYSDISKMPFSMQIIAASGDKVNKAMARVAKKINLEIGDSQKAFLQRLLGIENAAILTANYSTELEQALGMKHSPGFFYKCQHLTKEVPESRSCDRLHRYSEIDGNYIWHIHGDVYAPNSIIMGNYYYGGLVSRIHQYLDSFMRGYRYCEARNINFVPKSWVDYFMFSDVYMLGFSMAFSEMDLWYLIGAKKRSFPDSDVYFYLPKEEVQKNIEIVIMLRAYGVKVISDFSSSGGYEGFYDCAIEDIKSKCAGKLLAV